MSWRNSVRNTCKTTEIAGIVRINLNLKFGSR
jgi:hypothetical protein